MSKQEVKKAVKPDIAVIGLSGLFPGSDSLDQFWENLINNKDCRSQAGERQMGRDAKAFLGKPGEDDSFYCINGGYINDFSMDAEGINLSEERLASLDDVYQWALYVAREALKDSGYLNRLEDINTGVILGNLSFPTKQSNQLFIPMYHRAINTALVKQLDNEDLVLPRYAQAKSVSKEAGLLAGYPAALVAEAFGLKNATKFCLDAACASSIYSVKLACDYLQTGRSDLMLAGAVSAADPFFVNLGFSVFHAYPENQISSPLDKRSQGLFAGEGAGMLVLKRLDDAIADGDEIRAVIKGGGLSNDGKGQHVLSPNTKGQVKAFERAYENADINPASIDYIECHATGTPLGDKVELNSLETFFTPHLEKAKKEAPMIGSVKSNLGHLLTAAGMPAMTKVILSMKNDVIPGSINIQDKQQSTKAVFSKEKICSDNVNWNKPEGEKKRAGVSVFGFGGSNAHMIFEEAPRLSRKEQTNSSNKTVKKSAQQKMYITGMDAHFGNCESLAELECLILEDRNTFTELPENRWRGLDEEPLVRQTFADQIPRGGYIESFDLDFLNFRLPPHIDERLIPQQLLLMKVVDNALKDAQLSKGGRVAVLVAMGTELELHQIRARVNLSAQFDEMWLEQGKDCGFSEQQKIEIEKISKDSIHHRAQLNQYTSAIGNIMASRISALWDFSGPAFTVSAEENSVCQALEIAQLMFEQGEADAVVVAAVDLSASVESLLLRQQYGVINSTSNPSSDTSANSAFSFDKTNQGWSIGEGAGAIVLENDVPQCDHENSEPPKTVYASIDALAFSNVTEGPASSEKGESSKALVEASKQALADCEYDFKDLEYWELAASGFKEQDRVELEGILKLSTRQEDDNDEVEKLSLAIGSVKHNVGHSFAASGIVSLIKTSLCLHNRVIPGVSTWSQAKDNEDSWQNSSLYIPQQSKTWFKNDDGSLRHAAMNSIGIDGRVCFVALSESHSVYSNAHDSRAADENQESTVLPKDPLVHIRKNNYLYQSKGQLFSFKGGSVEEILLVMSKFSSRLSQQLSLNDFILLASKHFNESANSTAKQSLIIVANDYSSLLHEISLAEKGLISAEQNNQDWFSPSGSFYTPKPLGEKGKVSFVYPGAFNSYLHIVKDLAQLFPELHNLFAQHSGQAATLFSDKIYYPRSLTGLSPGDEKALQKALPDDAISSFENGISVSVILTDVLKNIFGCKPDSAFGYSMGEVSMMYALGVWGKTDAMSQRLRANPVFQTRLAGPMDTLREQWGLDESVEDGSFWCGFALLAPIKIIKDAIKNEKYVRLILINTPNEGIIAGKPEDCRRIAKQLKCESFEAALGDVIHCDWVREDYKDLASLHILDVNEESVCKSKIDFYTAVGNKKLAISSNGIANNIAEMYCNPVDFVGLTETVYEDGARIFIELGARGNSSRHIDQILAGKEHVCVSLNRKASTDKNSLLRALAKLSSHGVDIDLSRLYQSTKSAVDIEALNSKPKKKLMVNVEVGGNRIFDELEALNSIDNNIPKDLIAAEKSQVKNAIKETIDSKKVIPIVEQQNKINEDLGANLQSVTVDSHLDNAMPQEILNGFHDNVLKMAESHEAFLQNRKDNLKALGGLISAQLSLGSASVSGSRSTFKSEVISVPASSLRDASFVKPANKSIVESKVVNFDREKVSYPNADIQNVIWGPEDLVEFAEGDIANVFGDEYRVIDSYARRVRLPTTEYLLVDRVTKLNARIHEYQTCSMTTEYDVPYDFWYSAEGQIPWAVAVESGQCDLLLISYLGIDFQNQGERVYRLLDCELTFMDDVAMEGDTLRYDITINSYARSGDGFLFFFSYDCFVGNKLVLTMRNGAAGFFSDEELNVGKGVIETEAEKKERLKIVKQSFTPLLNCSKREFNYQDMLSLCDGNLASCFGDHYVQEHERNPNLVYSAKKMLMIERITELDPAGGSWGLGLIVGEKTLDPDHWYFPCHFKDDQVMAGSLMSDGCSQLLRFYSWFLGLHTLTEDAVFQPISGLGQQVRCRGQVVPQHSTLSYRMEITEIGTHPKPYAKANVDIILNGKIVVDFKNLGLFLGEISGTDLEKKIKRRKRVLAGDYSNTLIDNAASEFNLANSSTAFNSSKGSKAQVNEQSNKKNKVLHDGHVYVPGEYEIREHPFAPFTDNPLDQNVTPDTLPFTQFHFIEFATGRIANCFGEEFGGIYDGRTPPRTPNADLQLTSRVLEIDGERNDLKRLSSTLAEFDVPEDAWFFTENSHSALIPYSIIMEIALQPNGFISAWVGTTLLFPEKDLFFRNLDGSGTLVKDIDLRGKTIQNKSTLLSTTAAGNTIIQSFKYDLSVDGEIFYEGTSVFGYFLKDALTHQLGMDKGAIVRAWHTENNIDPSLLKNIDLQSEQANKKYYLGQVAKPTFRLANPKLDFLDEAVLSHQSGRFDLGYVYAEKTIDSNDWFFPCHFHQDPVMPGSLGVEAMLQAMQLWALDIGLGESFLNPRFSHELGKVSWKYRGQIIPNNKVMSLDMHISKIDKLKDKVVLTASGSLYKDGLRIYELHNAQLAIIEN